MARWRITTGQIDHVVVAQDQFEAWDTLRDRPLSEFGLVTSAEADENMRPIAIRTSQLLFRWNRDDDARTAIEAAVSYGLPDTTQQDMQAAGR